MFHVSLCSASPPLTHGLMKFVSFHSVCGSQIIVLFLVLAQPVSISSSLVNRTRPVSNVCRQVLRHAVVSIG